MRSTISTFVAVALLAPITAASTWVVAPTPGPGVDFTDIASAVSASVAGDVILVRPGTYAGFNLGIGVSVLGDTGALVTGDVRIASVPAGPRATLANLSLRTVQVLQCSAAVTLEDLVLRPSFADMSVASVSSALTIQSCTDVRVRAVDAQPLILGTYNAVSTTASRVELTHSRLQGTHGHSHNIYVWPGAPEHGGNGLLATGGKLHVSSSDIRAGNGGSIPSMNLCGFCPGGNGGVGIRLSGTEGLIAGPGSTYIQAGYGGDGPHCPQIGIPGAGVVVATAASLRVSHVLIAGGPAWFGCYPSGPPILGAYALASPSDPTLTVSGVIQQGQPVTYTVHGEPGHAARLFLGRQLTVQPIAGSPEDQLLIPLRGYDLGTLPPTGVAMYTLVLPTALAKGTLIVAQARTTAPGGAVSFTQSVPITLR